MSVRTYSELSCTDPVMTSLGVARLKLAISLLSLIIPTMAISVADHPLQVHLTEWRTLPSGERVSCNEKMHRHHKETWKRRMAEASTHQWQEKHGSRGRRLSNSNRSLVTPNTTAEVDALLAFRSAILLDPTQALANWTMDNKATKCSDWKGVTCDEAGHVTQVVLPELRLNGTISPAIGDLAHLSSLNLSGSNFWGSIPSELGQCQNLSVLDLSQNTLGGEVPPELFNLPSLEILWLWNNTISGGLPEVLHTNGCRSLNEFWIDNNDISGALPSSFSRCKNLTLLSFTNNHLNGSIPGELGELHQLQQLWLDTNRFTGRIPSQLGSLTKLTWLVLEGNYLGGQIPPSLGTLSDLQVLDLKNNNLTDSILPSLGNCSSLVNLLLGYNQLTGTIPEELGNLSNIQSFGFEYNWKLTGSVPGFLAKCSKLRSLFLGACGFTSIAPEIWSMKSLQQIVLFSNNLTGELPLEVGNCTSLLWLDLGWYPNRLTGSIPPTLGLLSILSTLSLQMNLLTGGIPTELGMCSKLENLMLGQNRIYGSLPVDFTKWPSLKYFSVTGNTLVGGIPPSFGGINSSLVLADFSRNRFTGGFPAQINSAHLSDLRVLLFSHNEIEGSIPSWFGNLKSLQVLDLSFNKLTGSIPQSVGNLAGYKVKINDTSSKPDAVFTLNQRLNLTLKGNSVSYSYFLQATTFMDMSSNALRGEIPVEITQLIGMKYLTLSNNSFEGNIWRAVENMTALESLDLSQNNLSGPLPLLLPSSLSTFKVSLNNLNGAIPTGGQYDTFQSSYYLPGNPGLCGAIIQVPCAGDAENSVHSQVTVLDYISFPGFGIGAAAGFCVVAMTTLLCDPARVFVFGAADKRKDSAKIQPAYGLFNPKF